ncbi:hypothetical protein NHX12_026526 [Muraenolepis orangiensis]|uniref:TATA box binding protein (TBP)-associated factor, RNA polymerase I, A n=1 Tax=Muraenolepis orangiensis TaxID=630683 RepID=A0A9Q0EHM2_9TELE|nr:hypothetical protein NHX12_026526 [Muraenolepis orangiensis]
MADLAMEPTPNDNVDGDGTPVNSLLNDFKSKSKLPLPDSTFFDQRIASGFHKSLRSCQQKLKDAMLHREWHKAAGYMSSYFQAIEDTHVSFAQQNTEIIWKTGTDILGHLPTTRTMHYNDFYEQMKLFGLSNYLLITLEHSFHLMVNGQIDEARHQLSIAETWRHGTMSEGQSLRVKLVKAYSSLLDFFTWCDKRDNFSTQAALSTDEMARLDMEGVFKKSTANLKEILKKPGVWDPFILSYVEMMEHYQQHKAVSKVLEDYAYSDSFPPNPNAHVYLYRHLKKLGVPEKKLRRALKVLHDLVPSHQLMPEYFALLLRSDKQEDFRGALGVSLLMLDYACWKTNVDAWKRLEAAVDKLKTEHVDNWNHMVGEEMASRRDWWPAFHFTHFHAKDDLAMDPALHRVKTELGRLLFPDPWPHTPGLRPLAPDSWAQTPGPTLLGSDPWPHTPGLRPLAPHSWAQTPGPRLLGSDPWPHTPGLRPLAPHSWAQTPGPTLLGSDPWPQTTGLRPLAPHPGLRPWPHTPGLRPLAPHSWAQTPGSRPLAPHSWAQTRFRLRM